MSFHTKASDIANGIASKKIKLCEPSPPQTAQKLKETLKMQELRATIKFASAKIYCRGKLNGIMGLIYDAKSQHHQYCHQKVIETSSRCSHSRFSDSSESELFDLNNFHVFMNFANKQFPGKIFFDKVPLAGIAHCEGCLSEAILRIKRRRYRLQVQQKVPQKSVHSSGRVRERWKKTRWIILILNAKFDFSWVEQ